jgi:hypothetical protein
MTSNRFRRINEMKSSLSDEQKKKLIVGLKKWKSKMINEEVSSHERNVIAKTFTDTGEFDPYVNKNRGIQFTSKELDSIANFKEVMSPTAEDQFMVRYENTDDFGNNTTTVIKKFREGTQFVFVSFTKNDNSVLDEPETPEEQEPPQANPKMPSPSQLGGKETQSKIPSPVVKEENEPVGKQITLTKTIPFTDEITGSDILSDFLRKLDL